MSQDWTIRVWDDEAPPKRTWVAALYKIADDWQIVKTCKHGCCVYSPSSGNLILPKYWRYATNEEVEEAETIIPTEITIWDI